MLIKLAILRRAINPENGEFPSDLARWFIGLAFTSTDRARYSALPEESQLQSLSKDEQTELEGYLNVNDFLLLLKMTAETSRRLNPAE